MEVYIPRFFKPPEGSFFLFGPRGTGKSTFLKHNYPNALWIDLLKPDVFRKYSAKPERIIELVNGNPNAKTVIVDEVQKTPEILSAVHNLIEENKNKQFILTGSSARKLKRSGVDLLAGRVISKTFHPFLLSELKQKISLDEAIRYGTLPVVLASNNAEEVLETYVSLYIREEVQLESFIRNIGNFSRFLESVSFSNASLLNISNVARECRVERKVVENYIGILEDILLAFRLSVFTKKAKRKTVQHPKFYFFDTGVFQTLRPKGPFDRPEEIGGAALEGLVFQQIQAWNNYSGKNFQIYFWRTTAGVEVDFVLYGQQSIYAIEVKNSDRIRPGDLQSLAAFRKDYPEAKSILLYRGNEKLLRNNTMCIPVDTFLSALIPNRKFSSIIQLS